MSSNVEKIKEKLNIVDVVSQYVKLEKAGSNFRARCPFHNEKTPSFFVSPARNSYYCFGCNAKGDIFTFVEQFEGLDFIGALKTLGEKAGVDIKFESSEEKDEKSRLHNAMESASLFFEDNLKKEKKIQEYLISRGLEKQTIKDWRIGYAPESWNSLYDYLKKKYSVQEIVKIGLIKKKEQGSEYYDRFRGRIMFPIFDSSGRIIAFSGRIFKDDEKSAKYINSPETPLFSKSKTLYGYDRAKYAIRKQDYSIIVEGQMDLIASHQAGFANTVALSGTALTAEQISLLHRLSNNVILAFDSDTAGVASSGKSAKIMLASDMDVKIAHLSKGDDPSEAIRRSKEEWKKAVNSSKHIIEFYLDTLSESIDDKRKLRLKAREIVIPYIARIQNKIDQAHFISLTAHRLDVPEEDIREEVRKIPDESSQDAIYNTKTGFSNSEALNNKRSSIEVKIIGIILWQKGLKKPIIDFKSKINELERILGKEKVLRLLEKNNTEELLFEAENIYNDIEKLKEEVDELILNLEQECIKEDLNKTLSELKSVEKLNDSSKISSVLKKYKELSDKLTVLIG